MVAHHQSGQHQAGMIAHVQPQSRREEDLMTTLEYLHPEGLFKGKVPLSPAVKSGKFVFVSGTPAFDAAGTLMLGNFSAQMKQVMENIACILTSAGAGWDRVVKMNVMLIRREDFDEMNRVYATYFSEGNFPARTSTIVAALPQPGFLLEIECVAMLK